MQQAVWRNGGSKPADNEKIKSGEGSELWKEKPRQKSQKDIDARWTEKNKQKFYGYKDHTKTDVKSKLIKNELLGVFFNHYCPIKISLKNGVSLLGFAPKLYLCCENNKNTRCAKIVKNI